MKIVMLLKGVEGAVEKAQGSLQIAIAASYGPEVVSVSILHSGRVYMYEKGYLTASLPERDARENPFFAEHFNLRQKAA
jgi:hypothetical protein